MKRVQEKVKDIVEVRPFTNLHDFAADPAQTLEEYHFTDITADLMAKWLDRIADVKPGRGAALALAGFRGVGKSHYLATLGALASHPELRSKVDDSHVSTSSHRLVRRHYAVAYVRRGTHDTLLEELKNAIAELLESKSEGLSDSSHELLMLASQKAGELPAVLLIDTALGRDSRVNRDDGILLSEIAETAKALGIFVGIALDDDIAGANGVNSPIASSFEIHYLDQEHLYKIVDSHIFPKQNQMLPVLHEIYESYRMAMPGFRWSEQRFSSLYPLHPSILEIAPFIRLYLHEFALLGFASEAGVRIMGRPANSLIALDEVFDNVERGLRIVDDLTDAFAAFDALDRDVVAKTPVMKRLRAKLILKGLLLSSLDGEGATASELSAAMLIFDENAPDSAIREVEDLLDVFAEKLPGSVSKTESDGRESKYAFKLIGKDDLNAVLAEAIEFVPVDIVPKILNRAMAERFSDLVIDEDNPETLSDCNVVWRGGMRRGKIAWRSADPRGEWVLPSFRGDPIDWLCVVNTEAGAVIPALETSDYPVVEWKLGALRKDEVDSVLRYHVLRTNSEVREEFAEHLTSAFHSHTIAVDKIWQRSYLQDSVLVIDGFEYNLTDEARSAHTLSELFSIMLESMFAARFPLHPYFSRVLEIKDVSRLIGDLFGGAAPNAAGVQQLAEVFALPLGLVSIQGDQYMPESIEALMQLPLLREALDANDLNSDDVISLAEVYERMQKTQYGLTREAQHLVLAAFVAQRHFEFVTSSGNRINRRSLDLQIIWDDIIGIAKPSGEICSSERLLVWASLITGNSMLGSLENSEGRMAAVEALTDWLAEWEGARLLQQFDVLSDENLNARVWRSSANVKKTFGVVAESVTSVIKNSISLDQCLQSIADVFSDSEDEFENKKNDLVILQNITRGAAKRNEITAYLSLAETTSDSEIEELREQLQQIFNDGYFAPSDPVKREIENLWPKYKRLYSKLYIANHDAVMNSPSIREKINQIMRTDLWYEFEGFSAIPVFEAEYFVRARTILRELRQLDCNAEIKEILEEQPFCRCSFRLSKTRYWESLPDRLWKVINEGLKSYRNLLKSERESLTRALNNFSSNLSDDETAAALANLLSSAKHNGEFGRFSIREMQVLTYVMANFGKMELGGSRIQPGSKAIDEEIPTKSIEWESELDRQATSMDMQSVTRDS